MGFAERKGKNVTDETPNGSGDLNPEIVDTELDAVSAGADEPPRYCTAASCQPEQWKSSPPIRD
ncbi:hypothetical protein LFM09_47225 [Lentzea alba]|uniref:hypothetical protein n=1 Tax=Lentzea alba TaxID=2714351 RepID=UPI0039BF8D09